MTANTEEQLATAEEFSSACSGLSMLASELEEEVVGQFPGLTPIHD
ncbi:MAG: hypothetical protein LBS45_03415 [Synergistaceae bacterium]|nr:hypothetical protein [Synergistaceae bacterium]